MASFGERLKNEREKKGLSQQELADRLKLSQSSIAYYERDKKQPPFETLNEIADYFEVQTDYLLGRTNNRGHVQLNNSSLLKRYSDLLRKATELGVSISFYGGPSEDITEEMIEGWEEELAEFEAFRAEQRQKKKK